MMFPTNCTLAGSTPSRRRFSTPEGSETNSRSESASVTMRLISSGIVRSKLRRPASTCTTGISSLAAASACQRAGHVAKHHDGLWAPCHQHLFVALQDARGLRTVRAGAHFQIQIRRGNVEHAKEAARHGLVVVLARVYDLEGQAIVPGQGAHQRRQFDKVGSSSGDQVNHRSYLPAANQLPGFQVVHLAHPVHGAAYAFLQRHRIGVFQIAQGFAIVHLLGARGQHFGVAVLAQLLVGAGDFQNQVRQVFDRVILVAADVVDFTRFEIVHDIGQRAHGVFDVGAAAVVAAEHDPGQSHSAHST